MLLLLIMHAITIDHNNDYASVGKRNLRRLPRYNVHARNAMAQRGFILPENLVLAGLRSDFRKKPSFWSKSEPSVLGEIPGNIACARPPG